MRSRGFSPPSPLAGRPGPATRNGFRFLLLYGRWAGSDQCGRAPRTSAHRAIVVTYRVELCVAVVQVDEVGGGDPREIADFGGAFAAEIEGWVAEERAYGELQGAAQSARTLGRGVAHWMGGWRP